MKKAHKLIIYPLVFRSNESGIITWNEFSGFQSANNENLFLASKNGRREISEITFTRSNETLIIRCSLASY